MELIILTVAGRYASLLPLVTSEHRDLALGLELYVDHASLDAFDAILAAVAINTGVEALVSGDEGYKGVPGLRWLDPRLAVKHLLTGT